MPRSEARVATDRPHRYGKQLASHLGRRIDAAWDEDRGEGRLVFPDGAATMKAEPGALALAIESGGENLERLEDVVGRHLVRFGAKDELVVSWQRDTGEQGQTYRNSEDRR